MWQYRQPTNNHRNLACTETSRGHCSSRHRQSKIQEGPWLALWPAKWRESDTSSAPCPRTGSNHDSLQVQCVCLSMDIGRAQFCRVVICTWCRCGWLPGLGGWLGGCLVWLVQGSRQGVQRGQLAQEKGSLEVVPYYTVCVEWGGPLEWLCPGPGQSYRRPWVGWSEACRPGQACEGNVHKPTVWTQTERDLKSPLWSHIPTNSYSCFLQAKNGPKISASGSFCCLGSTKVFGSLRWLADHKCYVDINIL